MLASGSRVAGGEDGRSSWPAEVLGGGQEAKFRARYAKLVCSLGCVCPTSLEDNTGLALPLCGRGLGCLYGLYPVCSRIPQRTFFLLVYWVGKMAQ